MRSFELLTHKIRQMGLALQALIKAATESGPGSYVPFMAFLFGLLTVTPVSHHASFLAKLLDTSSMSVVLDRIVQVRDSNALF